MSLYQKIKKAVMSPRVSYQPLVEVTISKDALIHNLNEFKKTYRGLNFAPVLKSNAYGHGLIQVAKILDLENCPFFVVDSFYEALLLRLESIQTPILVLGFTSVEQIEQKLKNVSFGVTSLQQLTSISRQLKTKRNFHLKLDTGMHRQGIMVNEIEAAIKLIKANSNIKLEGLCTHLADAENIESNFNQEQLSKWTEVTQTFKQEFDSIKYFHIANTAGANLAQTETNVCRLGIGLYGMDPIKRDLSLKPVLELMSVISQIKDLKKDDKVGYDLTFEVQKDMKMAVIPVGYFEGLDRRLSNKGWVKIGHKFCPIVGLISMNMSAIDVSDVPEVKLDQSITVFSRNKADLNSIEKVAEICGTIQREILIHIPQSLRRTIV